MDACTTWITGINMIIVAISKHIITQYALPSCSIGIRRNESAQFGVVEAGLEVIEFALGIVVITPVAQGVDGTVIGNGSTVVSCQ